MGVFGCKQVQAVCFGGKVMMGEKVFVLEEAVNE